jgi:hypothetical protein
MEWTPGFERELPDAVAVISQPDCGADFENPEAQARADARIGLDHVDLETGIKRGMTIRGRGRSRLSRVSGFQDGTDFLSKHRSDWQPETASHSM